MRWRVLLFVAVSATARTASYGATDHATRQEFENFSDCTVERNPRAAAELVMSTELKENILERHSGLVSSDCIPRAGKELRLRPEWVQYGLAEALLRREYSGGLPTDIELAGPIPHVEFEESDDQSNRTKIVSPEEWAELQKRRTAELGYRALSLYTECIARIQPSVVLSLVLSAPDSDQETEAFDAMKASLSSCMTKDQTVILDKALLRGALAMNLYRLAHAPRVQGPTRAK